MIKSCIMEIKPIIRLQDVWKVYQLGKVEVPALQGVNLDVEPGSFVTIMGPSGSGKSTLLNMIGCLDVPSKGKIFLDEEDWAFADELAKSRYLLTSLKNGVDGETLGASLYELALIPDFKLFVTPSSSPKTSEFF